MYGCDLPPKNVCSYRAAPSTVVDRPRAEALLPLFRWNVVPDAMHEARNMVHGVLLKAVEELL